MSRNPLKIRASLGLIKEMDRKFYESRNPLKIRASLGPCGLQATRSIVAESQSLKDQGKSRTQIKGYAGHNGVAIP